MIMLSLNVNCCYLFSDESVFELNLMSIIFLNVNILSYGFWIVELCLVDLIMDLLLVLLVTVLLIVSWLNLSYILKVSISSFVMYVFL